MENYSIPVRGSRMTNTREAHAQQLGRMSTTPSRRTRLFGSLAWLGVAVTLLIILKTLVAWSDRDLEFVSGTVAGKLRTPVLTIQPKMPVSGGPPSIFPKPLKAVLIHGISASKSFMIPLGLRLAHAGMECHLIDLPGHGQSAAVFSPAAAMLAIHEVLRSLERDDQAENKPLSENSVRPVVIIGHSLGGSLALMTSLGDQRACVVALSPATAQVTSTFPSRMLVVLGEFDLPTVRKGSAFLFKHVSGISLPAKLGPGSWSSKDGFKKLVVLPWMDHTSTILRDEPVAQIVTWLRVVFPGYPFLQSKHPDGIGLRLGLCTVWFWLVALVFDLSADLVELFQQMVALPKRMKLKPLYFGSALRNRFGRIFEARERDFSRTFPGLWPYALATFLAVSFLLILNPWKRLGLLGGGFLAGFLCYSGILLVILKQPRNVAPRRIWVNLLTMVPPFGFLVFLVGPEVTQSFAYLSLCSHRVWRIPLLVTTVFPFFLGDEWVSRVECGGMSHLSRWCFHLSGRCVMAIALMFGFFILKNREFLVVLILPALTGLSILCWVFSGRVYHRTGSVWASALCSALVTGWFLGIFFAQQ